MDFLKQKSEFLRKKDKSRKGEIDKDIKKLVDLINSKGNYYTTSSCSGRIVLIKKKSYKKQDCSWIFVKHKEVDFDEIRKVLERIPEEEVWFREEPLIMHICCKNLEDANRFLGIVRKIFKRAGIISINKKIIIEIIGTEFIDTIISKNKKLLVSDEYLKFLVKEANKKLRRNKRNIKRFHSLVEKSCGKI
jgi:tRNA wybutosine-synthesizing protein 3